jgi:hypothetical protein
MALLSALLVQLMMLSVPIPVDSVGQAGQVTTSSTDASGPFYLTLGLVIAAIILIVVHPGGGDHARSGNDYYTR